MSSKPAKSETLSLKQNKTKQNKTKQNKTKQNKTKPEMVGGEVECERRRVGKERKKRK